MDEQAGILKAIAECPDDLTHRLVYADWLEDHGQTTAAQFIRAQCTLRQLLLDPVEGAHEPVQTVRYPVAIEIMRLRPEVRPPLLAPFLEAGRELREGDESVETALLRQFSFWTHRGLVEDVEVYGGSAVRAFISHADAIFNRVPLLRLMFSNAPDRHSHAQYHYHPPEDPVAINTLRPFLLKEALGRLQILDLRYLNLGNSLGYALLRTKPSFTPRRLLLAGNPLSDTLIKRLQELYGEGVIQAPDDDIPF
jgi:uncharacterized protein (TIGR02996 family)